MQAVLFHALECSFIKKWNPDHSLYVIFEEIKTSIKITVVPPRLRDSLRTASLRKEKMVIDGAQSCKMTNTVACEFLMGCYRQDRQDRNMYSVSGQTLHNHGPLVQAVTP